MSLPRYNYFVVLLVCLLCIFISGCSGEEAPKTGKKQDPGGKRPVKMAYVDWASEKASSNVVKAVIEEEFNRRCELLSVSLIAMWEAVAAGDRDCTVAAWLPLQDSYYKRHKSDVDNLGPNLEPTRLGLVVPEYVDIDSIEQLNSHAQKFGNKIIGIDPYAGIMEKARRAIKKYDLDEFELVSGSGPTMTAALESAVKDRRWIVVTGWTPHWKHVKWSLKYLDDPKKVFGQREHIATIARKGLKQDMPEIYAFLDNFRWKPEDMAEVMLMAQDKDTTYAEAAEKWIRQNRDIVKGWIDGH